MTSSNRSSRQRERKVSQKLEGMGKACRGWLGNSVSHDHGWTTDEEDAKDGKSHNTRKQGNL